VRACSAPQPNKLVYVSVHDLTIVGARCCPDTHRVFSNNGQQLKGSTSEVEAAHYCRRTAHVQQTRTINVVLLSADCLKCTTEMCHGSHLSPHTPASQAGSGAGGCGVAGHVVRRQHARHRGPRLVPGRKRCVQHVAVPQGHFEPDAACNASPNLSLSAQRPMQHICVAMQLSDSGANGLADDGQRVCTAHICHVNLLVDMNDI
jgi:hypothetical protein